MNRRRPRVWVYGTLRPSLGWHGGWNAERVFGPGRPSERATLRGTLFSVGDQFPAMLPLAYRGPVVGELVAVSREELTRLDAVEGIVDGRPHGFYQRVLHRVTPDDGGPDEWAWVYEARAVLFYWRPIPSGDWGAEWERIEAARQARETEGGDHAE